VHQFGRANLVAQLPRAAPKILVHMQKTVQNTKKWLRMRAEIDFSMKEPMVKWVRNILPHLILEHVHFKDLKLTLDCMEEVHYCEFVACWLC